MSANTSQSQVDGYGFQRAESFDHKTHDEFMKNYLPVLTKRAMRWSRFLGKKETIGKSAAVKRFCRKGIPAEHRPMAWMCLSGAQVRMDRNPALYKQMVAEKHSEELEEVINMDIHRTFPDNIYFASPGDPSCLRQPLFNVLVALGHKNKDLGYCQGMNFTAGLLLLVLKSEEKVFWLMDTLLNNILPGYYEPDMVAVKTDQEVLGEIVKWKAPDIASHLDHLGLAWCLIGMKWFICVFADVMPVDTVLRIWDCLFYEGSKILIRASLTLVLSNRQKLLRCKNFSEVTDLFKSMVTSNQTIECHTFLQSMFNDVGSLPMSRINRLRKECEGQMVVYTYERLHEKTRFDAYVLNVIPDNAPTTEDFKGDINIFKVGNPEIGEKNDDLMIPKSMLSQLNKQMKKLVYENISHLVTHVRFKTIWGDHPKDEYNVVYKTGGSLIQEGDSKFVNFWKILSTTASPRLTVFPQVDNFTFTLSDM